MLLALMVGHVSAQWSEAPGLTQGRVLAQQAYANGKIWLGGGSTGSPEIAYASYIGSSVSSTTILNSPGGTSWTAAAAMAFGRVGGYAGTINGHIYIVGGHTSASVVNNQIQMNFAVNSLEYDPVTNSYTARPAPPVLVTGAAGVTVGTKLYLFGGITVGDNGFEFGNWCQVYDITTNTWEIYSTPTPMTTFYSTASAIGQTIYLMGGTNIDPNTGAAAIKKSVYKGVVGPGSITWTPVKDYPIAVASAASGVLNGKLYVAGGELTTGATNKVYRYDEAGNKWDAWYSLPTPGSNVNTLVNDGTSLFFVGGSGAGSASTKVYKLGEGSATAVASIDRNAFYMTTTTGSSATVKVNISNSGIAALEGGVNIPAEAQAWMSTTNGTFTGVVPGASKALTLTLGGPGVNAGNYHTVVNITTNDAAHAQIPVDVYLYVRDNLPQQATKVVIEEATGTWCGWCPDGHRVLADIVDNIGEDNIIAMAYHGPSGSVDPYVFAASHAINVNLGVEVPGHGYPSASIQRWMFPGETALMTNRGSWSAYVSMVLGQQPIAPMELKILSYKYNAAAKTVTAKLQITSSVAVPVTPSTKFRLNAMLTQDSLDHDQTEYIPHTDGSVETIHHDSYYQRHAVRAVAPDQYGMELSIPDGATEDNVLLPGTVFTQEITFSAAATTDVPRSEVVFLVHRTELGNKFNEIYQGQKLPLNSNITEGGGGVQVAVNTPTSTKQVGTSDTAAFATTVKNNGTSPIDVTITRTETSLPNSNWSTWFCIEQNCTSISQTTMAPITIAPGETKNVTVRIKGTTGGQGHVTLHFDYGNGEGVDQMYTATVQGAGVETPTTGAGALRLSQNSPNPATTFTSFSYSLPSPGTVTIELFNMTGEKVNTFSQNAVEAGGHNFEVNVSALPSGTYSVRLSANGATSTRLFNVTR